MSDAHVSKLRIPPVSGFLITGVIIGPSALKLVDSISEIETLAEIGVIFWPEQILISEK